MGSDTSGNANKFAKLTINEKVGEMPMFTQADLDAAVAAERNRCQRVFEESIRMSATVLERYRGCIAALQRDNERLRKALEERTASWEMFAQGNEQYASCYERDGHTLAAAVRRESARIYRACIAEIKAALEQKP